MVALETRRDQSCPAGWSDLRWPIRFVRDSPDPHWQLYNLLSPPKKNTIIFLSEYIWLVSLKNSMPPKNMVDYRAVLLKHSTHHFGVFTMSVQPLEPGEAFAAISGWWSAPRGSWLLAAHGPLQQRHHQGILVSYLTNFPNAGLATPLWILSVLFTNFPRILYCHWKKGMLQDLL